MTLLFRLAEWHALAKLRLHTDSTLTRMETATTILGQMLRQFRDRCCSEFVTVELPKEAAARARRQGRNESKNTNKPSSSTPLQMETTLGTPSNNKTKKLNLSTYKIHALGDYVQTIRLHGTTDSYSTQTVNFPHYIAHINMLNVSRTGRTGTSTCEASVWPY